MATFMSVTPLVLKQNIWQLKKKMDLLWFTFSEILVHGYVDHGMGHDGAHLLTSLAARKQTQEGTKDKKYTPKLHPK